MPARTERTPDPLGLALALAPFVAAGLTLMAWSWGSTWTLRLF